MTARNVKNKIMVVLFSFMVISCISTGVVNAEGTIEIKNDMISNTMEDESIEDSGHEIFTEESSKERLKKTNQENRDREKIISDLFAGKDIFNQKTENTITEELFLEPTVHYNEPIKKKEKMPAVIEYIYKVGLVVIVTLLGIMVSRKLRRRKNR